MESLHGIETELSQREKELREREDQLKQTKERLHQTKNHITLLNQEMEQTQEKLVSRLIAFYKMRKTPSELVLLTSASYIDLLRTDKYLRAIIDFDAHLVETYHHQMALKKSYQETLVQDELRWQQMISEIEEKKEAVEKTRETKQGPY